MNKKKQFLSLFRLIEVLEIMALENTKCEALINADWHTIEVEKIYEVKNEILKRCPECKAKIKLHKGQRQVKSHFEHFERNPDCRLGDAFEEQRNYTHKSIKETEDDLSKSYNFGNLLSDLTEPELMRDEEIEKEYFEGAEKYRIHKTYERDTNLSKDKKAKVLKDKRSLCCEVCGFDFMEVYGERGRNFIECHHNVPVSKMKGTSVKLDDLSLLCSNCHSMIHRNKPWISVEGLKKIVDENKK
jgi:predicted HNH restriction endonuclease